MTMQKTSGVLVSLSILLGAGAAYAEEDGVAERYKAYISGGIGVNAIEDTDADIGFPAPIGPGTTDVEFDTGWAGAIAAGLYLDNAWRVEIEGAYRDNDLDAGDFPVLVDISDEPVLTTFPATDGELTGWSVMLNALKDFRTDSSIRPYIGAGIGFAERNLEMLCSGGTCAVDDDQSGLAYQGIIGLSADIGERTQFFTDYRYFVTDDFDYTDSSSGVTVTNMDDVNHTIMAGIRVAFAPREAMASGPAAMPANYIVYFGFDRDDLTSAANDVVNQVVRDAQAGNVVRLDLEGHTDRAGSDGYNDGLSVRRVQRVKSALMAQGIAEDKITVASFGESRPAVDTADGVAEPLNRRVTIVIEQ